MKKQNVSFFKRVQMLVGIGLVAFTMAACGTSREMTVSSGDRSATPGQLPKDVQALWEKRHVEADLKKAIEKIDQLVNDNPNSYEYLIIASRAYYVMGDGHLFLKINEDNEAKIKEEQKVVYDKSIKYAEKAMTLNPAFRKRVVDGKEKFEDAIDALGKDYVDAIYWRYAALARWSRLEGTGTLLQNKGKFTKMVKRIEALEPNYFFGAVYRFYGGSETLSPTGNMAKGKENFEKAIKIENNFFGNHVLYADVWASKKLDKNLFTKELNFALNNKPEILGKPEWIPEQIIEQEKAKKFMKDIDSRNFD
ncbi:MAG: TRAP transporter TatT component family protein [Leptospiraceae bacterium]|nr:TRAP transporter TatT component family protein [Leptospiraceae bacterium]